MICEEVSALIPIHFAKADNRLAKDAIARDDLSAFPDIPAAVRQHLEQCSDCLCDVDWYVDVRDEVDVARYPCIHLAYAASSKTGHVIEKHHGMFSIKMDAPDGAGIVIGFCPWCGKELNVSAVGEETHI